MIPRDQFTVHMGSQRHSQPVPSGSGGSVRVRVWLVDDDRQVSLLMASLLSDETGFDCSRRFTSAAAMLEALADEIGPEVILLDIQIGSENGLDAIRPIKALAPGTRVLMLTSFYDRAREERARNEGASDFLLKSYPVEEIAHRIHNSMDRPPTASAAEAEEQPSNAAEGRPVFDAPASGRSGSRGPDFRRSRFKNQGLKRPRQGSQRFALWGELANRLLKRWHGIKSAGQNRKEVMP